LSSQDEKADLKEYPSLLLRFTSRYLQYGHCDYIIILPVHDIHKIQFVSCYFISRISVYVTLVFHRFSERRWAVSLYFTVVMLPTAKFGLPVLGPVALHFRCANIVYSSIYSTGSISISFILLSSSCSMIGC
jgi:hypothetical protein